MVKTSDSHARGPRFESHRGLILILCVIRIEAPGGLDVGPVDVHNKIYVVHLKVVTPRLSDGFPNHPELVPMVPSSF